VKVLRSLQEEAVFDCPEPVRLRYAEPRPHLDIWKFNHKIRRAERGGRLCVEVYGPATLHWSADGWRTVHHDPLEPRGHGVWTYEWPRDALSQVGELRFTLYWPESRTWEGRDFSIRVE
jgi:glucoamylase